MGRTFKIALVLCAAAAGPAHAAAYVATSPGLDSVNHRILAAHNSTRAEVGAPPLQWDPTLAVAAASYGPALSRAGQLVHSPRAGRENQRENLWMGQQGRFGPEQMVAVWTDEKRLFLPGQFPNVSRTGNWADVAHYQFAPDGGFESGADGWALSGGAAVVSGNSSLFVRVALVCARHTCV